MAAGDETMAVRLDDIDYFLAVAGQGSIGRAAVVLGVSQPAVTKGLQRLERELGFPLFVRGSRGVQLTPVAEQFLRRTRTLRANLADAIKEGADLHLGVLGVVRVGCSPLYAGQLFSPAFLKLRLQRPAARVRLQVGMQDTLQAALRLGDLDLAIYGLPDQLPDDLQAIPLLRDDNHIVVRRGHPLLARGALHLHDLVDADWMLPAATTTRRTVEERFAGAGLPAPRVALEYTAIYPELCQLVQHSDLVALCGQRMLDGAAGAGVRPLPLAEALLPRQVGVVVRAAHPLAPLAARFLELLQEGQGTGAANAAAGELPAEARLAAVP
jgi:DNA-binding transcriptional LysR family regulator